MIYFDNAATTQVDIDIVKKMEVFYTENYANPSSLYDFGYLSEKIIDESRKKISAFLHCSEDEIIFTPSGTFSNNLAIGGIMSYSSKQGIISSKTEHKSVLNKVLSYTKADIKLLSLTKEGIVDLDELESSINANTRLVSIMHVNNETGNINDIEKIGSIIKEKNPKTIFHVDGIQGFCKIKVDLNKCNIDLYSMSGHKIKAPKGIGALYIRKGINLNKIIYGGGQEKGLVSGTENVASIFAMGEACKNMSENIEKNYSKVFSLRNFLAEEIQKIQDSLINTNLDKSSPYILNLSFSGIKSEILLHYLEKSKIYISTGSACSKNKRSYVIEAMNINPEFRDGVIRISFSPLNKMEECIFFTEKLKEAVNDIRKITGGKI